VAILLGLVLGTLVAIPFGATNFSRLGDAALFQLSAPFHFGTPTFFVGAIISMFIVMLVIMTETTADILAIGEVVDKQLTRRDVTGGLQADMLSTAVAVTGIKSRFVVAVRGSRGGRAAAGPGRRRAGPVRHRRGQRHPHPEQGRVRGQRQPGGRRRRLGMGVIPIAVPEFYDEFPTWFQVIFDSGISAVAITAILPNLLFNYRRGLVTEEDPPRPIHPTHPHRPDAH